MLYEVALLKQPTKKDQEDGKQEEMIMAPTPVIARDDKAAAVQAVARNADKLKDIDLAQVQVLVVPFA